ncbi:hypothetical protein [Campylobacter sp.]|uniref:hypothetical protein n=2 Tax=Campylobacter sp. TaxID=205 RepID=UPI002AA73685|nr:hypothetical protein [Campylobacter sp.]MCI6661600.1 hypothetical protein [Campylobacter sp.]
MRGWHYTQNRLPSQAKKTKKDKKMKLKFEKITNTKTLKEYATSYKGVHARITSNVSLKEEYTHELYKAEYILTFGAWNTWDKGYTWFGTFALPSLEAAKEVAEAMIETYALKLQNVSKVA